MDQGKWGSRLKLPRSESPDSRLWTPELTPEFNVPIVISMKDFTATALNLTDKIAINQMHKINSNQ